MNKFLPPVRCARLPRASRLPSSALCLDARLRQQFLRRLRPRPAPAAARRLRPAPLRARPRAAALGRGRGAAALRLSARRRRRGGALSRGQDRRRLVLRAGQPRDLREAARALQRGQTHRPRRARRGAEDHPPARRDRRLRLPHAHQRTHPDHGRRGLLHRESPRARPAARHHPRRHRRGGELLRLLRRHPGVRRQDRAGHVSRHAGARRRRRQAHAGAHPRGHDRHPQDAHEEGRAHRREHRLQGHRSLPLRPPEIRNDRARRSSLLRKDLARDELRRARGPAPARSGRGDPRLFARNERGPARAASALLALAGEHEASARRPALQERRGTAGAAARGGRVFQVAPLHRRLQLALGHGAARQGPPSARPPAARAYRGGLPPAAQPERRHRAARTAGRRGLARTEGAGQGT